MRVSTSPLFILALLLILSACRSTKPLSKSDFSIIPVEEKEFPAIIEALPNYSNSLHSVSGKGRAIVSEPGNSDRVTIEFETDSLLSLLIIKNRIGIVGGVMLVDQDSILIYNKIDKEAQKVSVTDGRLTSLNELASVNLLDLLNFKVRLEQVSSMEHHFNPKKTTFIIFKNGGYARVSEETGAIDYLEQPRSTGLPYAAIRYENYGNVDGYKLPRKITILSADEASKVIFQIRSLDINPSGLSLAIDIPKDIPIQRR